MNKKEWEAQVRIIQWIREKVLEGSGIMMTLDAMEEIIESKLKDKEE